MVVPKVLLHSFFSYFSVRTGHSESAPRIRRVDVAFTPRRRLIFHVLAAQSLFITTIPLSDIQVIPGSNVIHHRCILNLSLSERSKPD